MTSAPLMSCVVPVYNGARFLAEALDSVLAQPYRPLEIIVVDDGSTDETAEVCSRYGARIHYERQDNAGPAAARNRGIRRAQGQFLAFQDADDLWHPEKLARQWARFGARPELEMCITHVQNFWAPEMKDEEARLRQQHHQLTAAALPGYTLQTLLVRRESFERVGYLDESLRPVGEDTDWFIRAREMGLVSEMLSDVLVYRRMHEHNISRAINSPSGKEQVLKLVLAKLSRRNEHETR